MPRKRRQAKGRTTLTARELVARRKWGGILPWLPELTPEQVIEWETMLRAHGIEPSGESNIDVMRYQEKTVH